MNEWDRLRMQANHYKQAFPPGTRVVLNHMGKDPNPIADETRGTVEMVDDIGTVFCAFDNGRNLGLVPGEDSFRKLTQAELEQEQQGKTTLASKIQSAQKRCEATAVSGGFAKPEQEH